MSNGVQLWSGDTVVSSATVMIGETLSSNGNDAILVFQGGTATSTTVNEWGWLCVSNGGTATSSTVNDWGQMLIYSGGMAVSITVNDGGTVHVKNGGTADDAVVNCGGYLDVNEGSARAIRENGGYVSVGCDAAVTFVSNTLSSLIVSEGRRTTLHSGTTANNTAVANRGGLYICGGAANNTAVSSGGSLEIYSGGVHSGSLQIASGASVSGDMGATIDFTVAEQKSLSTALVSNWKLISGGSYISYTITVNRDQTEGIYFLADGAMDFSRSVTVKTADNTELGTLSVGETKKFSGTDYTLLKNGEILKLCIGVEPPGPETHDEVKLCSHGTLVSAATVMTGEYLYSYGSDSMFVSSGGTANSTTVTYGGILHISSGGIANNTTLDDGGGVLYVSNGGIANSTIVNDGGCAEIFSGGKVNTAIVNRLGYLTVSSGGTATNSIINSLGGLTVSSGGTATAITASSGAGLCVTVAPDTYIQGTYDGSAFEMKNGYISGYTVNSGGDLTVSSGGTATNTTISGGYLNVTSGGTLSGALQIGSLWAVYVDTGAIIDFTVAEQEVPATALINDWSLISGGAYASYTITVKSNQASGKYSLAEGAADFDSIITVKTTDNTELGSVSLGSSLVYDSCTYTLGNNGGLLTLEITSGGPSPRTGDEITLYSDGNFVSSATIMTGKTLQAWGNDFMFVSYGGTATSTTVNSGGNLCVESGGTATETTVNSGGSLYVDNRGMALAIKENGGDVYADGADVTFIANSFSSLTLGGGNNAATLHSGTTATDTTVNPGGYLKIFSGGTAINTTVNSGGYLAVSSGGTLSGALQIGSLWDVSVYPGGIIDFTVAEQEVPSTALINNWSLISYGAYASYTITVKSNQASGKYSLAEGAADFDSIITVKTTDNAELGRVSLGSSLVYDSCTYTLGNSGGLLTLEITSGGPSPQTGDEVKLYSSGTLVSSATVMTGEALQSWGNNSMFVSSGGTATNTIVNAGGHLYVSSGGTATNTTINTYGYLYVSSGGTLSGALQIGSFWTVYVGTGAIIDFTVAEQEVPATALINDWRLISYESSANYTITVNSNQASGKYSLAEGAAAFGSIITVKTTDGTELGTLSVGEEKIFGTSTYTLEKTEGLLSLSIVSSAEPKPARSDVDGNNISDVVFQYTGGNYQIGLWMNGTNTWQGQGIAQPSNWELLGAYDMDQNGKADIVMRGNIQIGADKGAYIGYYKDGDVTQWQNISYLNNPTDIDWHLAIGNLTGSEGCNSIVWHAPDLGALGVWTDGTANWVSLAPGFNRDWEMIGCGDFDGNGKDEVLFTNNGNLYTTDIDQNFASLGGWGSAWEVKAIGDFSGDGKDDLILQNANMVIKFADGKADNWSSVGVMDASDWFIVGAGDYNGDEADDLLVRQYSTGMLGYYESGDMSKWVEMGRGVDMNWTVIA